MSEPSTDALSRVPLNLRIPVELRDVIDRAAESAGQTRTDFILGAARRAAEETLLDRAWIGVGAEAHAAFLARLDAPPAPNDALRRTLLTPAPWDAAE